MGLTLRNLVVLKWGFILMGVVNGVYYFGAFMVLSNRWKVVNGFDSNGFNTNDLVQCRDQWLDGS